MTIQQLTQARSPSPRPLVPCVGAIVAFTLLAIAQPAIGGTRVLYGGAYGGPYGLLGTWDRPVSGSQPASRALYEETGFYVTESGTYTFEHTVVPPLAAPGTFPRFLYLYSHAFDTREPSERLLTSVDISEGDESRTFEAFLVAHNMYWLVLSTVGPTQPEYNDDFYRFLTLVEGPGDIYQNRCFDDTSSDAWGHRSEATLAYEFGGAPPYNYGTVCVSVSWEDRSGTTREALVSTHRTRDSIFFYFFNEQNIEINVKLVDGCDWNGHRWLFASASTDVPFTISALGFEPFIVSSESDYYYPLPMMQWGILKYSSAGGEPARAIADLHAINCE